MLYTIQATITYKRSDGTITAQLPTFLLDSNIQGIKDANHAKFIAEEIINPTRNKNLKVEVSVA
jgi:hypothetical protein